VGDLVIKVVSPTGAVATVLNRPGRAEGVDDGNGGGGDSSNATRSSPLTFDASASDPAESMGNTLEWYDEVCEDDGRCVYAPSPDSAADAGLTGLVGVAPAGEWRVCVGDAGSLDDGTLEQVGLEVHAW
jgi:subtilisin-like proprotein convertase family protein